MPLNSQYKMVIVRTFHGLLHLVDRAPCDEAQSVAWHACSLMMTGVDGDDGRGTCSQGSGRVQYRRQLGLRIDCHRMRVGHSSSRLVVDALRQVLVKRAGAPHIQRLHAIANAEDRLARVVGVLQKKLVGVVAQTICSGGRWMTACAVLFGINVGWTAGQENSIASLHLLGNDRGRRSHVYDDGFAPSLADGVL